jgi:cell fate (sporulation/competence/biofilm development) regulator YlbF (YheA/YmcA/DUF963 family)
MLKKFLMKQALRFKGVDSEQAEAISKMIDEKPELVEAFKKIEANPELKKLMESMQKEIEEKVKNGMDQTMASVGVMQKHKYELAKYKDLLEPLMMLMQR